MSMCSGFHLLDHPWFFFSSCHLLVQVLQNELRAAGHGGGQRADAREAAAWEDSLLNEIHRCHKRYVSNFNRVLIGRIDQLEGSCACCKLCSCLCVGACVCMCACFCTCVHVCTCMRTYN